MQKIVSTGHTLPGHEYVMSLSISVHSFHHCIKHLSTNVELATEMRGDCHSIMDTVLVPFQYSEHS